MADEEELGPFAKAFRCRMLALTSILQAVYKDRISRGVKSRAALKVGSLPDLPSLEDILPYFSKSLLWREKSYGCRKFLNATIFASYRHAFYMSCVDEQ